MIITIHEITPSNDKYLGNRKFFRLYFREKESEKFLLDPLILTDDSFDHVRLILAAFVDKDKLQTEIEILHNKE